MRIDLIYEFVFDTVKPLFVSMTEAKDGSLGPG